MTTILFIVIGLCLGSFLNVVVYRLPRKLGFISGRSVCPHCNIEIASYDLMPVFSYLALRGRCRHCRNGISIKYPIVEALFAVIVVLLGSNLLLSYDLISVGFAILIAFVFMAIALIDFEHYVIPDKLLFFLILVATAFGLLEKINISSQYLSILSFNHLLWGLFFSGGAYLLWAISKGQWLGFGDVKYLFVLGLIFGIGSLPIVYGAIISGAIVGVVLMLSGRLTAKSQLPFGVFLSSCAIIYLIYGWRLVDGFIFFQMIREIAG